MSGVDGILSGLIRTVLHTPFDSFDEATVSRAKKHVIDVVGCAIGGARAPGCPGLLDLLRGWGGAGEASVLGGGGLRLPAPQAAMMNSVLGRSYDFEPCGVFVHGRAIPGHISGSTVPAALAAAELNGSGGRELLTALVLGDDLAARVTAASQFELGKGFDPTGTVNVFGATAIAARLRGLPAQQLRQALGIALNQMGGTFQNIFDGALSFKLPQGLAAHGGLLSVALAEKGFTGADDPLLGPHGYFDLYGGKPEPECLTRDLGRKFFANNTFKPYPCCRSNHAAIDGAIALTQSGTYDAANVSEVIVDVAPVAREFAVGKPFVAGSVPQVSASFSLQYTVATALLRSSVRLEHFTEEHIADAAVAAMVARIRLDDAMPKDKPLAARVRIRMKDGTEQEVTVDAPRGNELSAPLGATELREKFIRNVAFAGTIPLADAEEALEMLQRLEEVDDLKPLFGLLAGGRPQRGDGAWASN